MDERRMVPLCAGYYCIYSLPFLHCCSASTTQSDSEVCAFQCNLELTLNMLLTQVKILKHHVGQHYGVTGCSVVDICS